MSGGMQRRLELACALVHEPTLLFLDEPTAGIDPILRAKVWDELHRLRDAGRTLLVTTQYVGDAEDCDSVALIADGRLVALGHPDELRAEALGGEVIDVETSALFDATAIDNVPGVVTVNQRGPREFTATVNDSAVALPAVVDAVTAAGSEVVSAQEIRPSFDEVFAVLVERANADEAARVAAQEQADAAGIGGMNLFKVLTRILAFVGKEIVEVVRRPGALASLILGPFIVMAIFGVGYSGYRRPLETVVVIPPESGLPTDVEAYGEISGAGLEVTEVSTDEAGATQRLRDGAIDVVLIAPGDVEEQFRAGKQSTIEVQVNVIDPVDANYATFLARALEREVNRIIVERIAEEGQTYALSQGASDAGAIPPSVVAAPTKAEIVNIAPSQPGVVQFFGTAVLALILQHMAVTLIALSVIRERTTGLFELFRVSPIRTGELVIGKVLAFGILSAAIAALTLGLLILGFGVPMLGDSAALAGVVLLLIAASLGLGLLVAAVSDSERQAVQLALLLLLASVFFSGFVLGTDEFSEPVRTLTALLPVTNGIQLISDVMLRGSTDAVAAAGALLAEAVAYTGIAWLILRRALRSA